jgi:hypothetical protein
MQNDTLGQSAPLAGESAMSWHSYRVRLVPRWNTSPSLFAVIPLYDFMVASPPCYLQAKWSARLPNAEWAKVPFLVGFLFLLIEKDCPIILKT